MIYQIKHGLCVSRTYQVEQMFGGNARDDWQFINAVLWIFHTGFAARYAKNPNAFLAAIHIKIWMMWLKIS
jgi:hypothetical protein